MLGWLRAATAWASRSKRSLNSVLEDLIATMRLRRVSRAFHTSPIPPAPRGERSSYGPSLVPAERFMAPVIVAETWRGHADSSFRAVTKGSGFASAKLQVGWAPQEGRDESPDF